MAVDIERVTDPASCRLVEDIQREAWGMSDRAVVPAEQIRAVIHNGGLLLLATSDGAAVGFCYGFVGLEDGEPILCSHMLAVRPDAQSRGVGRQLKLAQRTYAAARGFDRITWTFDPLQARNAYLNLHRLGAYARRYLVDHYGPMDDAINRGLPTDRLVAEWPATGDVPDDDTATDVREAITTGPWVLGATGGGGQVRPATPDRSAAAADVALAAVPADVDRLRETDPEAPAAWRAALRTALAVAFDGGLTAVDLVRDVGDGYSAYVLRRRT
ncbi:MAG: GNAT family N-acetyltransferase [Actinobacteria bacterium]|nr:GNAT family N-acetyltransferase [Actinomycetota bacterium]